MGDRMDFSVALRALKDGERVAREGWNGKGMWLWLSPGGSVSGIAGDEDAVMEAQPYIGMRTVQGTWVPWLASQTDLLAEDWVIVR